MVPYHWHFEVVRENLPFLLAGLWLTVALTCLSMVVGLVGGMVVALARFSVWRVLRWSAYAYTELLRTTPLLVQIAWIFYVLPLLTGVALGPFVSGLVAVGLNVSAYMAEVYRAGIASINPGQTQAGLALGMTRLEVVRRIILPQATRRMVPPMASMWVSLFKDTSVLSAIGVMELMFRARYAATQTYRPLEIFTAVAIVYFIITYPQSLGVNYLFRRLRTQE
jgi:His/Glu/Gln/Arg/opine family amino acid ABC transporter permease subunit